MESSKPVLQNDNSLILNALGEKRRNYLAKKQRKHEDATRNVFSYMNIADVLRVAAKVGTIQPTADFIQQARRARNAAAHPALALVTDHSDVQKLAAVKSETLRLLRVLHETTPSTLPAARLGASAGR